MNDFDYETIEVGMKEHFCARVSEDYLAVFRKNTGDTNPLHFDDEFAVEQGYEKHVVFGMLTASYYSTLAGVYLPGKKSLIHSVNIKFIKPVYVDDTLNIEGVVTEKNDLFKILTIKATIKNQNNEKVSRATMKVGIL